jgi:hypothetical protein
MTALLVGDARCSTDQQDLTAGTIADESTTRKISLSLGASVYDPTDAIGRLPFNALPWWLSSSQA